MMFQQTSCRNQYELCLCEKEFNQVLWDLQSTPPILLEINELIYILILWNKPLSTGQFARVTAEVQKL